MRLSSEFKPQNTLKSVMSERMSPPLSKIPKVGISNYNAKLNAKLKVIQDKVNHQVYTQILEAMIGGSQSITKELREKKLQDLKKGYYNQQYITLMPNGYKPDLALTDAFPQKPVTKTVKQIFSHMSHLYYEQVKPHYTPNQTNAEALRLVQEEGIIFLDQIDKLAVPDTLYSQAGKGVSTEGVQRDLLPLLEGTVINTKNGDIKTDHILFIASGSFSMAKVEDLIPELLGRLPIRVSLHPISRVQLQRILTQPEFNLLFQQIKLMSSQKIELTFTKDAISEMAEQAYTMNLHTENIGARRLHHIVEKVMQQISFNAPNLKGKKVEINADYVKDRLKEQKKSIDLKKFLI